MMNANEQALAAAKIHLEDARAKLHGAASSVAQVAAAFAQGRATATDVAVWGAVLEEAALAYAAAAKTPVAAAGAGEG